MKNKFIKIAVKLLKRFIPRNEGQGRFLIVSTTALGDTLWATPAIENLRRSFPGAYIAVLTSPIGMEVLKHNPHIDQLYLLGKPFSIWKKLVKEKFDTILLFHASQRFVLPLCSLLGATRIVGTSGINKGLDELLTDPQPNHEQHEISRRLQITEHVGATTKVQTLSLFLQPEEQLPPRSKGPWIAIHPGSKDAFKRWPAENFAALGRRLKERIPCEILVTGNHSEKELMQQVASQIPGAHIYETNTTLRQFAALLNQMDLLISNDTGPFHVACALDRPVIAIYSPLDPAHCGPHHAKKGVAIYKHASCDPCLKRKCQSPFCFLQIGVDEVVEKALKSIISS